MDRNITIQINKLKRIISKKNNSKSHKLKIPQIALIYVFEKKHITLENASNIAEKYGYNSKYSGKGLYDDFLKFYTTSDRIAKPNQYSKTTLKNKIKLFESILIHLSEDAKLKAIDEIKIFKLMLESDFTN